MQASGGKYLMLRNMATKRITGHPPHICIVGAGISGLRCADVLLKEKAGIRVTIHEGRDRIGGRVGTRMRA